MRPSGVSPLSTISFWRPLIFCRFRLFSLAQADLKPKRNRFFQPRISKKKIGASAHPHTVSPPEGPADPARSHLLCSIVIAPANWVRQFVVMRICVVPLRAPRGRPTTAWHDQAPCSPGAVGGRLELLSRKSGSPACRRGALPFRRLGRLHRRSSCAIPTPPPWHRRGRCLRRYPGRNHAAGRQASAATPSFSTRSAERTGAARGYPCIGQDPRLSRLGARSACRHPSPFTICYQF